MALQIWDRNLPHPWKLTFLLLEAPCSCPRTLATSSHLSDNLILGPGSSSLTVPGNNWPFQMHVYTTIYFLRSSFSEFFLFFNSFSKKKKFYWGIICIQCCFLVNLELFTSHHIPVLQHFYHPKKIPQSICSLTPVPPSIPRQQLTYFLSLQFCLFWTFHVPITCGCLQLASFTSHAVSEVYPRYRCVRSSFIFTAWIHHVVFLHYVIHWWIFASFLVLNNAARRTSMDKSLHAHVFSFLFLGVFFQILSQVRRDLINNALLKFLQLKNWGEVGEEKYGRWKGRRERIAGN